jgi:DNA-directed RNA polymerase subunit RPC12/RpoP
MPVPFTCSACGAAYEVADDLAGKAILCRECQARGQVPAPAAPAGAAVPFVCPTCGKGAEVPAAVLGKQILCLGCGTLGQVTASGAASPVLRERPAAAGGEPPTRRDALRLGAGGLLLAGLVVAGGFAGASLARWRPRPSKPPSEGPAEDRPPRPGKGPPPGGGKGRGGKRGRPGGAPKGGGRPLT